MLKSILSDNLAILLFLMFTPLYISRTLCPAPQIFMTFTCLRVAHVLRITHQRIFIVLNECTTSIFVGHFTTAARDSEGGVCFRGVCLRMSGCASANTIRLKCLDAASSILAETLTFRTARSSLNMKAMWPLLYIWLSFTISLSHLRKQLLKYLC